ncbi:MAG: tripartite tricarboxylate transporter TctB family protein [Pseudomonadota bacterium]
MAAPIRNTGDLVSGALLAGLGLFIIVQARGWDYLAPDGPGPGFFPLWYGIAMVVLALGLLAASLKRRAQGGVQSVKWQEVGRALYAWAALTLCIASIKLLGFMVSLALLTLFVVSVMYRRPLTHGVAAGVLTSLGFYLLFPLALKVELPVGVFGF